MQMLLFLFSAENLPDEGADRHPHTPLCSGFWSTVFYRMRALMAFAT